MKNFFLLILLLIASCGDNSQPVEKPNRFKESLHKASEILTLERLTQDGRCIHPNFAPGDTIIYFRRLLAPNEEAASGVEYKDLIKPFGMNINSGELLTLSTEFTYPLQNYAERIDLPAPSEEVVTQGIYSPDSTYIIFETTEKNVQQNRKIYIEKDDQISQLTFGDISCYLEKVSNSGHYISALFNWDPSWIIIIDLQSGKNYIINRDNDMIDYMSCFSSDDKMMVFIRSDGTIDMDGTVFGDIWLARFNGNTN